MLCIESRVSHVLARALPYERETEMPLRFGLVLVGSNPHKPAVVGNRTGGPDFIPS